MLIDPAFAHAHLFPGRRFKILGRELVHGFSPKHWLALDFVSSPWLDGHGETDFATLVEAVNICAAGDDAALSLALSPANWPPSFLDMVGSQQRLCRDRPGFFTDAAETFLAYLSAHWTAPRLPPPPEGTAAAKTASSHPAALLVARAVTRLGMDRRAAWWAPDVSALQWDLRAERELRTGEPARLGDAAAIARLEEMGWKREDIERSAY